MSEVVPKNKVYSGYWQFVLAAMANGIATFDIQNPGRVMKLLSLKLQAMFLDNVTGEHWAEESIQSQRIYFEVAPVSRPANFFVTTGGTTAPLVAQGLSCTRSVNWQFDSYYFSDIIPCTLLVWNNHLANAFTHQIMIIFEVQEMSVL